MAITRPSNSLGSPNAQRGRSGRRPNTLIYHLLLLPGIVLLVLFNVLPMIGSVMAFQDFIPSRGIFGSEWVGWENFRFMFILPDSRTVFVNTLIIAFGKIIFSLLASLTFALLLHEVRNALYKRSLQTVVYLPHFLSWVILAGVVQFILAQDGMVNRLLGSFGIDGPIWLSSNVWFRPILIFTHVWKEFGFGAIVFLAALTGINPSLYEAAEIDGANRWHKLLFVTLPGIAPIVTLVAALSIGGILSAGFEQIFNLYNPLVYQTGDVIDTWVYRAGLLDAQYSLAAAVGLLQSVAAFILILISYYLAYRYADYRIF